MAENYISQLVKYIKKNLAKGYTIESLKWALINQDYSRSEVEKAASIANLELAREAPKLIEKPVIKVARIPDFPEGKSFFQKIKELFE